MDTLPHPINMMYLKADSEELLAVDLTIHSRFNVKHALLSTTLKILSAAFVRLLSDDLSYTF